jgi:hypothetical protein
VYAGYYTPRAESPLNDSGSCHRLRRLSLSGSPQRGEIIFQNLILQSKRNFAKKLKNNFFLKIISACGKIFINKKRKRKNTHLAYFLLVFN